MAQFSAQFSVSERTCRDLGWPSIIQAIEARTQTPCGRARVESLALLPDAASIEARLALVQEARALHRAMVPLPIDGGEDVAPLLQRAEKQAVLTAAEVFACARLMQASAAMRRFLTAQQSQVPRLAQKTADLLSHKALAVEIAECIEPPGTLKDTASYELGQYRKRCRGLHRQLKQQVEAFLQDAAYRERLQDDYYSVRGERYVLPIKASFRGQVPGIVHNASNSGQTVFVEPQEIVPLGNELAIAQSLADEEEQRILAAFSADLGEMAAELLRAQDTLAEIDLLAACARVADDLDAAPPQLVDALAPLLLRQVRHPLLVLQGKHVIANDIGLGDGQYGLVVSGPNAGGKTVAVTTVGLCQLMVRAGLPIPAAAGSQMPLVGGLCCAIGDAQDLRADLSTFSAHVQELGEITRHARAGWLALVDEIASGTDPKEGAALAHSVLEYLAERRVRVLVTTHLDEVKALGLLDERFVNACVGADPETHEPTYRLQLGVAGVSNAIDVAARMGVPTSIVARAREVLEGSGFLAAALARLQQSEARAVEEATRLASEREQLERARAQLAVAKREAERAQRDAQVRVRADLSAELDAARSELGRLMAALQAAPTIRRVQQTRAAVDVMRAETHARLAQLGTEQQADADAHGRAHATRGGLAVGAAVRVSTLGGAVGEVVELGDSDSLVRVGAMHARVANERLVVVGRGGAASQLRHEPRSAAAVTAAPVEHASHRCDLRGLRVEDAVRELERALDQNFLAGSSRLLVVHGHGSGALKEAVREALRRSPLVTLARPGESHEGGDGVTWVELGV